MLSRFPGKLCFQAFLSGFPIRFCFEMQSDGTTRGGAADSARGDAVQHAGLPAVHPGLRMLGHAVGVVAAVGRCRSTLDCWIDPTLFPHLKLECDKPLSNVAFNCNLRHYAAGVARGRARRRRRGAAGPWGPRRGGQGGSARVARHDQPARDAQGGDASRAFLTPAPIISSA